ncbi:MAG: tetratricopeptide repeat protein [Candidatus Hodarchaeota archaeon]
MSDLMPTELIQAEQLVVEGKFAEAYQLIEAVEKRKKTSPVNHLRCQNLKATLLNKQGQFGNALKLAEEVIEEGQKQQLLLQVVDALIISADAFIRTGRLDEASSAVTQSEHVLLTAQTKDPLEIAQKKGSLLYYRGIISWLQGDLNQAQDYQQKALTLLEEAGNKPGIADSLNILGIVYKQKGDFDRALKYYQKSLAIREILGNKQLIAASFNNIGTIYDFKGELDQALGYYKLSLSAFEELGNNQNIASSLSNMALVYRAKSDFDSAFQYLERALILRKKIGSNPDISNTLFELISVSIDKNDLVKARQYLEYLQKINDTENIKLISQYSRVAEALVLKTSLRTRNQVKATDLLEQVMEEEIVDHEVTIITLLNLCDLLLIELKTSGNTEILPEVKSLTQQLLEIARQQNSFSLLAETYLLQTKLALMDLNIQEARRLLTQSQLIAEEKGLHRLAIKISNEHDSILDQLNKWEDLIERRASLTERANLARVDEQMERMLHQRGVEILELPEEEPVMFLILDDRGITLFSKSFSSQSTVDDQLIGGFLNAIQIFSTQIFDQMLDRVKLEEFTLLMKAEEPFQLCYVFKGQTYTAQQKLTRFIQVLRNTVLWNSLLKFSQEGRALESTTHSSLEDLLKEVFNN